MQNGKSKTSQAQTVIPYAGSYVILLTSRLRRSPAQRLHSLRFDQLLCHVLKLFFKF